MMVLDGPEERGGAEMDLRWGDPMGCHFPLVPLKVLTLPYMALAYAVMWIGAFGVLLGYKFKISSAMFAIPYWYIFLLEKSYWNNHSYLFGLVAVLMMGTQANNYLSLDALMDAEKKDKSVPYWNYFVLKYQIFILYFVAGVKKSDWEWLSGYAMTDLSTHWVFSPFRVFLSSDQTDYLVVHWFAFLFDLTVCFWMMYDQTRPVAMVFCASFHLMNSRLFSIGMFPWVCLSTMPLFCPTNWPRLMVQYLRNCGTRLGNWFGVQRKNEELTKTEENSGKIEIVEVNLKRKIVVLSLISYMCLQAFLPFSHSITKGYNNWTNGLYGYSWDMMVNSWDTILVVVKVVDNDSGKETFLDPDAWTPNNRWSRHGDMMYQYAQCLKRNLLTVKPSTVEHVYEDKHDSKYELVYDTYEEEIEMKSTNVSIYVDVWCSMNGRFQQRMFDPSYDLLKAQWSPFTKVEWLLPLLTEFNDWRTKINQIQDTVFGWSNYTEAVFVADFPGLSLENYVKPDLYNVTLTVLEGQVLFDNLNTRESSHLVDRNKAVRLTGGESHPVKPGIFHRVYTVGDKPSCYMYTYMNRTRKVLDEDPTRINEQDRSIDHKPMLPLLDELSSRLKHMVVFLKHIGNALLYLLYGIPMIRRVEIH